MRALPHCGVRASDLAAQGRGWAAATVKGEHARLDAHVFWGPGSSWALISPIGKDEDHAWIESLRWTWTHARELTTEMPSFEATVGASVVTLVLRGSEATIEWAGDASAYLLRAATLRPLTRDHTLLEELRQRDTLPAGVPLDRISNVLVNMLGTEKTRIEQTTVQLRPDDRLVLCNRRLLKAISPTQLCSELSRGDLRRGVERVQLALTRGRHHGSAAVLVVESGADAEHPSWWMKPMQIQLSMEPGEQWQLFRGPERRRELNRTRAPRRWLDALDSADLRGLSLRPGDVLRVHVDRSPWFAWWDGARWQSASGIKPQSPVASGRVVQVDEEPGSPPEPDRRWIEFARVSVERPPLVAPWFWDRCVWAAEATRASTPAREVAVKELREHPERFDEQRVRFRDILRCQFEGMNAGGAWWTVVGERPPPGLYLADLEGVWSCSPERRVGDQGGYGHMGMSPAEVRARATLVSFDSPRRLAADRVRFAREFVPLASCVTATGLLQGWFFDGFPLRMLGSDARLPSAEHPFAQEIEIVFCKAYGQLFVADYTTVGSPRTIAPRIVNASALRSVRDGDFIEVKGTLSAGHPYKFPPRDGWPQCVNWPRLEGVLDVVLPEVATTPDRYAVPNVNTPGMATWTERLARGPRQVRVVGEVRRHYVWAIELDLLDAHDSGDH